MSLKNCYRVLRVVPLAMLLMPLAASAESCRSRVAEKTAVVDGGDMFPTAELSDWVSYAQQVAVMRVVGEEALPTTAQEAALGEGLVGRLVTLHTDHILWQASSGPAPPEDVTLQATGWIMRRGKTVPFAVRDAPRLEVGGSYVVPLTYVDGEWSLLSPGAVVPIADGRLAPSPRGEHGAAARLGQMTPAQLAGELARTAPDPMATKYGHLPPYERGRAVTEEKAHGPAPR